MPQQLRGSGGPRGGHDSAVHIDGSDSALRLDPIRPSGVGLSTMASPPLHHASAVYRDTTYSRDTAFGASMILGGMPAPPPPTRPRARTSTDEIRALLQRTNNALDKIVKIRESMEPFVDFKQFEKGPRRNLSRASSGLDDAPIIADGGHPRGHSYGSTISEDPVGDRSTGSTESTSSTEDMTSASELGSSRGETELVSSSRSGLGATLEEEQHREQHRRDGELSDIDDDDDDSTFSGGDELPPFKEARLERLKNITIAFHDGLPTEFFMALTRFLHTSVEVKTRHSRFSFFKDTFVGSDAVRDMVLTGFADDQTMALRFGHILVKLGYIEHVSRTDDQLHNNKDNFYRFTKAIDHESAEYLAQPGGQRRTSINANNYRESVLSRESSASVEYDFGEASCEVHALVTDETLVILARVLHKVFERKNKLLFYKGFSGCFLGAEAANVIRELRIGTSLVDAVLIGQAMLDEKIIEPISPTVTTFQDRYVFYRLCRVPS